MKNLILKHCNIVDATQAEPRMNQQVLIEDGKIAKISSAPIKGQDCESIDLDGRYLMPGLIDAHVHVTAAQFDLHNDMLPESQISVQAARFMENMLLRGFTSIRDVGGADFGLARAVDSGLVAGPRLFYGGKSLSQTGGHGDFRPVNAHAEGWSVCLCSGSSISRIVDGVSEVRKAVRDEVRKGAYHIKVMAAGGVASPTDRIDNLQFSEEEIQAIVEEARNAGIYVAAHVYTPRGIERCVKLGVRTIEHANLLDEASARAMAEHGAFMVPTLIIYDSLAKDGKAYGIPDASLAKIEQVRSRALESIQLARAHQVRIGFGTDLLGEVGQAAESQEFRLRARVETPLQVLDAATLTNAEIVCRKGLLGVVAEGAYADLLALDVNPLDDITVLSQPEQTLQLIMKGGKIYKDCL
ncbi:amidohydrolase family protein [Bordetella bronchialis]|uniref:metal-dependent hydrolase family protein n=1 Tax=Bordetella bronchialis TaxID=463025 RepID=UPI003D092D33